MRVSKIEYIDTIKPNMSCGTGYSEPDEFCVWFENGSSYIMWVDIWYVPKSDIREHFDKGLKDLPMMVDNPDEAYRMYQEALRYRFKSDDKLIMPEEI